MESDGVLSDPSGELVIKPCKQSEVDFYESTSTHPEILPHIPTFLGKITLGSDTATEQAAKALALPTETFTETASESGIGSTAVIANDWTPSQGNKIQTELAIVLGNAAHGFKKPNILDVKLGARLWADDAPLSKRARLDKVAEETTSGSLGLRIAGMKTYHGEQGEAKVGLTADGYKAFDKTYGRTFTAENIDEGFGDFFLLAKEERATGPVRKVIRRFIGHLEEIQEFFEKSESRMYSASLLFVYEGDRKALQDAFAVEPEILNTLKAEIPSAETGENAMSDSNADGDLEEVAEETKLPAIQSLKLIDFAHAGWTPGQGPDQNLLHGIRNVIKVLHDIS